jgi:hypothetical protein
MAPVFTRAEVVQQLERLYFHADPAVKQGANAYLMQFQEDAAAWNVARELLQESLPHVQFIGAQTLYLKVKRQWDTQTDKTAFVALWEYL